MNDEVLIWLKLWLTDYNGPKVNADNERLMRTLKEELVWLNEWQSPSQFIHALEHWIDQYNYEYLHSSLHYQTPVQFEQQSWDNFLLASAWLMGSSTNLTVCNFVLKLGEANVSYSSLGSLIHTPSIQKVIRNTIKLLVQLVNFKASLFPFLKILILQGNFVPKGISLKLEL